jgi:hypothetical protein
MVQYIPSPAGSYPYPNAGRGQIRSDIAGTVGSGIGDIFGSLLQAHQQSQQRLKQQALMSQLSTALLNNPSGPGMPQPPNTSGMTGVQKPTQAPMDQRISQIMPALLQLGIQNPHLAPLLGTLVRSFMPKQTQTPTKPTETWFVNTKTGEPSLVPKEGFAALPPQPVGSFAVANRMFINRGMTQANRDENHEAHKVAMEMRIKNHMDDIMGQLDDASSTFEQAYRLSNQVPRISSSAAMKARDVASGKAGQLEKWMSNDKAVDYYRKINPLSAKLAPLVKLATPKQKNDLLTIFPEPHDSESDKMAKRRLLRLTIKDIASREKRRVSEQEMMIRHQKDAELDAQIKQDYPEVGSILDQGNSTTIINDFGDQEVAQIP